MMDVLTSSQRRFNMSQIRGQDTTPELIVRRLVHSEGFRYRLHVRLLPGKPDLVFPRLRKIIFVHGCFWHRHQCPDGRPTPKTRIAFWKAKFDRNVARDQEQIRALQRDGWKILIVWECETRNRSALLKKLLKFLTVGSDRKRNEFIRG